MRKSLLAAMVVLAAPAVVGAAPGTSYRYGPVRVCNGDCPTAATATGHGDLLVEDGLEVDGTADLDGALSVAGNTTMAGTLAVTGAVTFSGPRTTYPWFSTNFDEGASKGVFSMKFDGTAFSTTADHVNVMAYGAYGDRFVFETNTTAAGTCTPTGATVGVNLCVGIGSADELTLTAGGMFGTNGGLIIPGTTPAWKACATATIADISTIAGVFLEVTTPGVPVNFSSTDPNYTSYAAIGALANENITVSDNTTGATDTTNNWADTEQHTVCVLGSAAGVITYTLDGVAPTATDAHTLADGVPHVVRWQELGGTSPGVVTLDAISLLPQ